MGVGGAIDALGQITQPRLTGQDGDRPKSTGGRPRAFNPAGVKTPEEALAYIRLLYQTGRIDELAGLLRRSLVFREAWQSLQRSSLISFGAGRDSSSPTAAVSINAYQSGLPALSTVAGDNGQPQSQSQNLESQVLPSPGSNLEIQPPRLSLLMAIAIQAYESLERYYPREEDSLPGVDLRV